MSFSGRVKETSHEGGVLVSFEGKAPRLGASIRISGGKTIGRVDTVLGPVDDPLIHVHPLSEGIDPRATLGSPVEIAPRVRAGKGRSRRRSAGYKLRGSGRGVGRGPRGKKGDYRGGGRGPSKRGGRPGSSGVRKGPRGGGGPSKRGGRPGSSGVRKGPKRKGSSRRRR